MKVTFNPVSEDSLQLLANSVSDISDISTTYLQIDGSNANTPINIGSEDLTTTGKVSCGDFFVGTAGDARIEYKTTTIFGEVFPRLHGEGDAGIDGIILQGGIYGVADETSGISTIFQSNSDASINFFWQFDTAGTQLKLETAGVSDPDVLMKTRLTITPPVNNVVGAGGDTTINGQTASGGPPFGTGGTGGKIVFVGGEGGTPPIGGTKGNGGDITLDGGAGTTNGDIKIGGTRGNTTIGGDLDHNGTNIGFYGVAPVARPAAYTQTYGTTTRTHAARTAPAGGGGSGADGTTFNGAECDALVTDQQNTAQILNQLIDDLQSNGILQ